MNTAERWNQINILFDQACEKAPEERLVFLKEACDGDDDLYHEVASLLDADLGTDSLLDGVALDAVRLADDLTQVGRHVGPYRLVRQLGVGGMGDVYLAERVDGQFEQQVALKLIKRGMDSRQILRRFQMERQILARLQHPNIARLLDGSVTEDGQPYFVMEYVDGESIDTYCDTHQLTIDERLGLFQDVCRAVLYAHSQLVVHRDLKPSNILITTDRRVKLLDFGIAKVLSDDASTVLTRTGGAVMTPEYASPEQVRGEPVSTSTDIYSLGVVLYELLAGHRPYTLTRGNPLAVMKVICEQEPERPSTAVSREAASTAEAVSTARRVPIDRLRRRLSGDLDVITLKALRKEPERRYGSVEAFVEDIHRHLSGLPVVARRDTAGYRAAKFVERHRFGVATTAVVVLLIATVVGFYTVQLTEERNVAQQERDRAQLEQEKAEQVIGFMEGLFESSDPSQARGDTLTVRQVMDAGAVRLADELADQPAVRARMMQVIAHVYKNLALYDQALPLLEQAVVVQQEETVASPRELARTLYALGEIMHYEKKYDAADTLYGQALTLQRSVHTGPHLELAATLDLFSRLEQEQGNYAMAESLLTEAFVMRRSLVGEEHPDIAESLQSLSLLRSRLGDQVGAEQAIRESLVLRKRLLGAEHPEVAELLHGLAINLHNQGKYERAEEVLAEGLGLVHKVFGEDHLFAGYFLLEMGSVSQDKKDYVAADSQYKASMAIGEVQNNASLVLLNLNNLATLRLDEERIEEAETFIRDALQRTRDLYGDTNIQVAARLTNLGRILNRQDKYEEAIGPLREAFSIRQSRLGPTNLQTISTGLTFGATLTKTGRLDEAEPLLRESLATLEEHNPEATSQIAHAQSLLGDLLIAQSQYEEAERLLTTGYQTLLADEGPEYRLTTAARERLVALYEAWGKPEEAARYRAG